MDSSTAPHHHQKLGWKSSKIFSFHIFKNTFFFTTKRTREKNHGTSFLSFLFFFFYLLLLLSLSCLFIKSYSSIKRLSMHTSLSLFPPRLLSITVFSPTDSTPFPNTKIYISLSTLHNSMCLCVQRETLILFIQGKEKQNQTKAKKWAAQKPLLNILTTQVT